MDSMSSPLYFRNDVSDVSLVSVPDLESLEEITDGDVRELLQLMSSHTRGHGTLSTSTASPAASPLVEGDDASTSATRSTGNGAASPQLYPTQPTSSSSHSSDAVSGIGTGVPRRSSAHQESARASPTTECGAPASPSVASPTQPRHPSAHVSMRRAVKAGSGLFPPALSPSHPQLTHVSDTAVLDAEQRRWSSQLVQECWMHQELHNVRWNEQRLLQHGAAYRPRAIASRTAVRMTHTRSLCIALNIDTAIIENAGDAQVEEEGEEGAAEGPRMPSMSSPEAEAWSPLLMWRSPALTPGDASTVLTQLSECLSEQYEGLAARPLPTSCCANARPSDLVQTLSDARKDAGDAKVIFHYLARGVPPPRGGNIYLMNNASAANGYAGPPYSKLSLDSFRSRVGFPLVFIADCAEAREILNCYIRMCEEQHQQRFFTSSREYQLQSSRQVSAVELDNLADGPGGVGGGSFDRVGSGADLSASDMLRRGRGGGGGGLDGSSPAPCAVLQDFFFIGASGSSSMRSGSGAGSGAMRDRAVGGGGGGYDDFNTSFSSLSRGGGGGGIGAGGAGAVSSDAGVLRHHVRLPSDILTSCLTTPLRMAVLWFIAERPELQELHPLLLRLFPGALNDKKTPLGQLQWYLQSIIECIAWSTLSLPEYSRLFREDVYVAPLFRGYILAERIIVGGLGGCLSVYPPLAPTYSHTLWSTWDNLVERACVSVLRAVHPAPPRCASVLEFRGWLDEQVTAWKYTRQDLLVLAATHPVPAPSATGFTDGRLSSLPATPDEAAVIMPSLLTESLRGMQAQLDGITQQSFERPRVFFAEIIGLQLPSASPSTVWEGAGSGDERDGDLRTRRPSSSSSRHRRGGPSSTQQQQQQPLQQQRPQQALLHEVAIRYSNTLRSSYSTQMEVGAGTAVMEVARGGVTPSASAASMGKLLSGSAGTEGGGRAASSREVRRGDAAARARGMPSRNDSRAALPTGRYQRTSQANLAGLSGATSAASTTATGTAGVAAVGASAAATPAPSPAAAVVARMEAHRAPSRLSGRKAEYVTNLFTNTTSAFQATSFQYTADLAAARGGSDILLASPATPLTASAAAQPPPQHTFPFMDRMPLLLQALLVAAHREKATELLCRLVDCGPAAVLQCAEANIYRFVLNRYWSRPDLRFLMPSTLFIYCKSCYADPELIGNAKQCDIAVKACAEILQSPVDVPPSAASAGAAGEEAPGAWQNTTLGPYASPYGQRMLAAALLTLIALHSDGGREACHRHGCFQLCCQLLHEAREEAPLLMMSSHEPSAAGNASANPAPAMPPIPRAPSNTFGSHGSSFSPQQSQNRAAGSVPPPATVTEEPPPQPPQSIATTYHVTLLTLFVSLLCNWRVSAAAVDEEDEEGGEGEEAEDGGGAELSPPLDGAVHQLSPTTPQVLAAGLRVASAALLNFSYSETSILRGAALRCFMMVLISPAPSQLSRNHFVEVGLRIIQGETLHRCELNTDLRLEELGMAYTTFRWLLDQLREDVPIEEIGQFVAVWIYKWFKLTAQGKTLGGPPGALGGGSGVGVGGHQRGSLAVAQGQRAAHLSSSYQPSARGQWMPQAALSYRGSSVVTPGSVYSHRGSNVLVPAARSVYGAAGNEAAGGGGRVVGSFVGTLGSGLRQHLTRQDHRRLQCCLPPLSNLVRIFFEHTQDACPYIRLYARKVVTEEFGFLHQSWYDDYAAGDLHTPRREDDYGGHHHHHHPNNNSSYRPNQRHRSYGARLDTHASSDAVHGGGGVRRQGAADPLTASSVDGGGDLTTYLPLREMLSAGAVFDELQAGGGPATGPAAARGGGGGDATNASAAAFASAPAMMTTEMEEMADPQPALLRRFISRLLRIASTNGPDVSDSPSSFPHTSSSRHRLDGSGDDDDEDDGDESTRGFRPSGSDTEGETSGYADARGGRRRGGSGHHRGGSSRLRRGLGGDGRRRGEEGYYSSTYSLDDAAAADDTDGDLGGTLLDSETLALHPLWAMDSTSMTNFAYGALSFLERFMLEKMDDSDPRHPMNLEKENALHHYFQRVERNIRAFAQDEVAAPVTAALGHLYRPSTSSLAVFGGEGVSDTTAGSRALGAADTATPPPPRFHCLGVGDIGQAGVPGYGQRRGNRGWRSAAARRALRSGRSRDAAARVSGSVDVVLFHPSEPLVITSTTGGLLSVWSYDHLGLPTTGDDDDDAAESAYGGADEDDEGNEAEEEGEDGGGASDDDAAQLPHSRQRAPVDGGGNVNSHSSGGTPRRRLYAKAQFFLRDVVGRSRSDLSGVARPRFMYDRFNPNGEAARTRRGAGLPHAQLQQQQQQQQQQQRRRQQRSGADGLHGLREREAARYPGNPHRRDGMAGGGGAWMDRAEAANALAALPSSYQQGHPHFYHGVGDLHLVDAAQRPLICAVRRFGAVEVFSHFTDRQRVRRVVTFETTRYGQHEGVDQCVSSYQSCTGLLYVSNGEGGVSAWDLGNEQRLATIGTLAGADAAAAVVGAGSISALEANPCTPYEYLVGSYGKQVCLFDVRDSGSAAARLGYAHPSAQFTFASGSPTGRHGGGGGDGGGGLSPLSSLCVRVSYSRRYPDAVVAGYACGTVAVWDRRYPKQPSLLFGAALSGAAVGPGGGGASHGLAGRSMPVEGGAPTVIRQLDVHACSKRFLTLTTTPTTLQVMQPTHGVGYGEGGFGADSPLSCSSGTSCVVESYDLGRRVADSGGAEEAAAAAEQQLGSEPGAACFHDFSPVLCVGTGGSVRLYGTSHLSTMATYMDVNSA